MTAFSDALDRFLADMEYPAMKDDLTREAARDGLPAGDLTALHALPEGRYDARCRVRDALAAVFSPERDHRLIAA